MTVSKTQINKRMKRKTNPELAEALFLAKKNNMIELGESLSLPNRKQIKLNLEKIEKETKNGERVLVPGKILGQGELTKKIKIFALGFSKQAEEKLKKAGCETGSVLDAIKNKEKVRIIT